MPQDWAGSGGGGVFFLRCRLVYFLLAPQAVSLCKKPIDLNGLWQGRLE